VSGEPLAIEQDKLMDALNDPERLELLRFWKALMLAKDVETFEALLGDQDVPVDRLDPEWVARFGRRR
jgi:hypothetical protein